MSLAIAASLSRQTGLLREMELVAGNIANASTTGYRRSGVVFAEHVRNMGGGEGLALAHASVPRTALAQGPLAPTGGRLDLAIEGPGFFTVETAAGPRLTRAGAFLANAVGEVVTPRGDRLLDAGGAPLQLPLDARSLAVAADGTVSADGRAIGQIVLSAPADPGDLLREDGVLFVVEGPLAEVAGGRILQGFLEGANVSPVEEVARMIAVQRAYELGQSLAEREDDRIRSVIRSLSR